MPYRRSAPTQARMDAQRARLLDAAVAILAEQGYAGCSMAAVAARAGVATGSVYRHFSGKAELAAELFRRVVEHEIVAVEHAYAQATTAPNRVVAVVATFARRALANPRQAYALLAEPAPVEAERLEFRTRFRDIIAVPIADGVATGVLPAQDPGTSAAALVGAVAEVMLGPLGGGFASAGPAGRDPAGRDTGGRDPAGDGSAGKDPAGDGSAEDDPLYGGPHYGAPLEHAFSPGAGGDVDERTVSALCALARRALGAGSPGTALPDASSPPSVPSDATVAAPANTPAEAPKAAHPANPDTTREGDLR